jgi:hypothetical protein
VVLGLTPPVATAWLATLSEHILALTEIGAALLLLVVVALGWIGWRPLLRIAEVNFWSLNALAVQPGYAFCREALRHLAEGMFAQQSTPADWARLRAASSAGAGVLVYGCAALIAILIWPGSRWMGTVTDLVAPHRLIVPTLANSVVLVSGYLATEALVWGFAHASWTSRSISLHSMPRRPVAAPGASCIFQYAGITCPACTKFHFLDRKTGKLLGQNEE